MTTLKCPVCGDAAGFEQSSKDADLYRCQNCDHCFSDPASLRVPDHEVYRPEYYEKNWFKNANRPLFEQIGNIISRHQPNASVLDVGCGKGAFLRFLHERYPSFRVAGIDIVENDPCEGIEFYQADALAFDLPRQFDAVVSMALIEHLVEVSAFVRQLKRWCAPEGLIIVMTCNDRSVLYAVARLMARMGITQPRDQLYSRHHVNHFNVRSLKALMQTNGIDVHHTWLQNIPVAAIDITATSSPLRQTILTAGAWGTFVLGRLTGRTYLQTVICRNRGEAQRPAPPGAD